MFKHRITVEAPHLKISVIVERNIIMDFLKEALGDRYQEFADLIKQHNGKAENKDKQIKIANLSTGKYVDKKKFDDAVREKEKYETDLTGALDKLKGFEGVDVNELKDKVQTLTSDLETERTKHQQQIADRDFSDALEKAITKAGGKNAKAIKGILDIEALKVSKDQSADIEAALKKTKETDSYLFESEEPIDNPFVGATHGSGGTDNNMASIRAAMGLPTESK